MINLGAFGLVRIMREGGASAREVIAAHVARSEEINPLINAIVAPRFADALAEAGRLDHAFTRGKKAGRLHGLPITVKECIDVCGMTTTGGVVGGAAKRKNRDAAIVRLLRREGAIVLGKTNLAQLSWGHETDNPLFGRTNNPWNLALTPGGSSGGEAAIVATGGSAVGVGTDSGGSVRVPAHYCGIHAFKPTSGRLANAGSLDTRLLSFQAIVRNQPGLLGRRVKDLGLVYHVLAGERRVQSGAGYGPPGTEGTFDLTGWRVGYYLALGASRPAPAVASAVLRSVRLLAELGAEAEEFSPPDPEHAARLFAEVFTLDGGAALQKMLGNSPRSASVDDALRGAGPPLGRQEVRNLTAACNHYRYEFAKAFHKMRISLIVCPPASGTAPPHNMGASVSFDSAALFNLLGMPAGVVAVPDGTGLPVGVQIAGPKWREDVVLRAMAAVEMAAFGAVHNRSPVTPGPKSGVPVTEPA
jgi:fatty acid amide hydrolase